MFSYSREVMNNLLVPLNLGGKDSLLVGELHCGNCDKVVDVKVGGKGMTRRGEEDLSLRCYLCGREWGSKGANFWVNEIRDWENRFILFVVGDIET